MSQGPERSSLGKAGDLLKGFSVKAALLFAFGGIVAAACFLLLLLFLKATNDKQHLSAACEAHRQWSANIPAGTFAPTIIAQHSRDLADEICGFSKHIENGRGAAAIVQEMDQALEKDATDRTHAPVRP